MIEIYQVCDIISKKDSARVDNVTESTSFHVIGGDIIKLPQTTDQIRSW